MQQAVISVRDLEKSFGAVRAVAGLSFEVQRGEIFGLLGPNGAGKTTVLEIVEGLKKATSGTVRVLGLEPDRQAEAVKQRIGIQLQSAAYFEELTLTELLDLFGSFYPKRLDPAKLLRDVKLSDKARARVGQLSGGQKQRFSIAASIVNDPEIVFLDEPTTGLDPQARRNLWEFILELRRQDRTVVLTTHYMEEAELLADRVAIVDAGKIVACNTPRGLIKQLRNACMVMFMVSDGASGQDLTAELKKIAGVEDVERQEGNRYHIVVNSADAALGPLLEWARDRRLALSDLHVEPATLEDVFLHLTGKSLRE
ncbi:MAG: ABC transporter ATP-binding protein [Parcubacteria group bacterium]